jgi:hypothetical protein
MDKGRDVAVQIEQGMHLDRRFMLTELGPGKEGDAKVDGG